MIPCHSRDALQFTPRRVPRSNGDLTGDGARVFAYDFDNRLSGVTIAGSSTVVSLAYDPVSRLAQQQTAVGAGAPVTTRYLYDGQRLAAELDGTGAVLRRYVHGPGTDQPVAWYEGAGTADRRWLHADERGSVIAWSNLSAGVVSLSYGPWGEPTAWGGSRFAYTGQIQIAEVQLYHYKGRVYDPVAGRFLQTDPIGTAGGANLYRYVSDDPINLVDPFGTQGQLSGNIQLAQNSYVPGYTASGAAIGGGFGAAVAGACDVGSGGVCALANPAIVAGGAAIGGGLGYYTGKLADYISNNDVPENVGPGPNAGPSVPAGPSPRPTREQQGQINDAGAQGGCHTCGTSDPGTKSGNWVGDHQPPTVLNPPGGPQVYLPQCRGCSNVQGGRIRQLPKGN